MKKSPRTQQLNDVRIISIPPATVVCAHYIGDEPEMQVNGLLDCFVREHHVHKIKPDLRHFGFNHPNPTDESGYHGYEAWVTIPDELEVAAPLTKKYFAGGLYAAHLIDFGHFEEWDAFLQWIMNSEKYAFAGDLQDQEHMCGLLEEHLNYFRFIESASADLAGVQLDLLIPVKQKTAGE